MESWRKVWRDGFAPILSLAGLTALRNALAGDDPRLLQYWTTEPVGGGFGHDHREPAGACAVGFCGWQGHGLATVGEVEDFFVAAHAAADRLLGGEGEARHFLNWFDETPRAVMIRELLPEVDRAIRRKAAARRPALAGVC